MSITVGKTLTGPAGTAKELLITHEPHHSSSQQATLAAWFLDCPRQSPTWNNYLLSIVHLRPIDGVKAHHRVPKATHEVFVIALDPETNPIPTDEKSWGFLLPPNVQEQVELPSDDDAIRLLDQAAHAVCSGLLPAEIPLVGAVEPWRTVLIKTAAHYRGEEHAS